jgi:hypothetical protein
MQPIPTNPERTTGHSLVQQVSEKSSLPHAFYKTLAIDILTVGAAFWMGNSFGAYLSGAGDLLMPVISTIAFSAFSVVNTLLATQKMRRVGVIALEVIAILFTLQTLSLQILGIAAGVLFFFLLWGALNTYAGTQNSLKLKFFYATRSELGKIMTALSLGAIVLAFPQLNKNNLFLSEGSFESFFGSIISSVANFYPQIDFKNNIGAFAKSIADFQISGNPAFAELPQGSRDLIAQQASDQIIGILKNAGVTVSAQESLTKAAYDLIVTTFGRWRNKFGDAFVGIWGVLLFFVIRSTAALAVWAINIVAFLIYQLLFALNLIHIAGEPATREVAEYT